MQRYQRSKLEVDKNWWLGQIRDWCTRGPRDLADFFSTSSFDLWYFCSLLTYKGVQYLIWKIWLISIWILKAKVMAWLLTWFIFAQSNPARSTRPKAHRTRIRLNRQFLIDLQLWPIIFLQPLDLQERTVPHLKDLIHIYLEPACQACS